MKKVDERKIKALGLFHCMDLDTYRKMIPSCVQAGYKEGYANKYYRQILQLDSLTDTDWQDLKNLLPQLIKTVRIWLDKHENDAEIKDIREIWKGIRLIGDSVGKFVKTELKIEAKKEEIHFYLHFDTKEEEIKHYKEIKAIADNKIKELIDVSG